MLTFEDCVELSELPEDVIQAIALHDHIPMMIALEMGVKMLHSPAGLRHIRQCILEDLNHYRQKGNNHCCQHYAQILDRFDASHPDL